MTLERRNPLPPGVYWADFYEPAVGGASIAALQNWLAQNTARVKLRSSVYHGPDKDPLKAFVEGAWTLNPALAAAAQALPDSGRARVWALFEVLTPTEWPATLFGYPTVAEHGVKTTEEDTVQRPDPEPDFADQIGAIGFTEAGAIAAGAAGVVVGLGVLVLLLRFAPRR